MITNVLFIMIISSKLIGFIIISFSTHAHDTKLNITPHF